MALFLVIWYNINGERDSLDNELMTKWEHEHDMARMEIIIKRLWILVIIIFVALVITNGAWLYYESQWEVVEETTEQTVTQDVDTGRFGDAVVAGVGDIYNGESKADGNNEDNETLSQKEEEKVNE